MSKLIVAVTVFVFALIVLVTFEILSAVSTGINSGLIQPLNNL